MMSDGQFVCSESCGWFAAIVSCVAFGSFGVPIKGERANSVNIDPLVMQSYKTAMCFITSWLVLFVEGFSYTPWGIVSGLFWVPCGVSAIYAIRTAGLAVSQGLWSTLIVIVSFIWGVFVFGEGVRTKLGATGAIALMCIGLWGMSYYSRPAVAVHSEEAEHSENGQRTRFSKGEYHDIVSEDASLDPGAGEGFQNEPTNDESSHRALSVESQRELSQMSELEPVDFFGFQICRRKLGLAGAVFTGSWGGSIMVPMHWASHHTDGIAYLISFSIGASIITLLLWLLRISFHLFSTGSMHQAFKALPSFHFRVMWLPGGTAGLLWSIGNVSSMVSVKYLGEAVGYSVTQSAMLVSGLWGLFYYHEVEGFVPMLKWLFTACVTICGILWLSHEHLHE